MPFIAIVIITLAAESVLALATQRTIKDTASAYINSVRTEAAQKALAMRETLSRFLDQIGTLHGLASLVTKARQSGDTEMEQAVFAEIAKRRAGMSGTVSAIAGFSRDGYLDWSNMDRATTRVYSGDREYVRVITEGAASESVGAPTIGRAPGVPILPFFKGQYATDGTLIGLTNVSVSPNVFADLARTMGVTGRDTLTVLRADGLIIARSNGIRIGDRLAGNPEHARMVLEHDHGVNRMVSPVDDVERIAASERVGNLGLTLVVGIDLQARLEQLEPHQEATRRQASVIALLIAILGGCSLIAWHWRQKLAIQSERMAVIRQSESLFRRMAEGVPDTIRLLDRDGVPLYANPAIRDLLGVEPQEAVGPNSERFVHPDDRAAGIQELIKAGSRQTTTEMRMIRGDGRVIRVQTTLGKIGTATPPPGVPAIVSSTRDVTDQREAEASLRRAAEELDAVLQAASGALLRARIDPVSGTVTPIFVSDSIEALSGFTPAEIVSEPDFLNSSRDPAFKNAVREHQERLLEHGRSTVIYRTRRKNGDWIWVEVFARVLQGEPHVMAGYIRDITRDRERDLQVAQTAQMAVLGELTTSMAHELNQPLTAISMVAQNTIALLDTGDPENELLNRKLERIVQQVARAGSIIDHMRIFGRRADDAPADISIASAIEGAVVIVQASLRQSAIEITTLTAPDLPLVRGHLVSLQQVLISLIGNASDAVTMQTPPLPKERRGIEIRAERRGPGAVIRVADHAGGIDESVLPRLFQPFFTTKPTGSGTGLGLSVAYGIITEMGGEIAVRNEGDGAVFEIRLPPAPFETKS